ncbi:MAG: hypothetical protein ACK55Z_26440, partial [bacterium]
CTSNSLPHLILHSHGHIHRGGAAPDVRLAPEDGGGVDSVIVPPSQELIRPGHQPVQVVDLHPGGRCVLHFPISKPLSLAILYLEPRRLGGHPVGDLLADVVALGHCPLHRSHRHLKQCSPEGSHEP